MKKFSLFIVLLLLRFDGLYAQQTDTLLDSIYKLRDRSRNHSKYTPEERLSFAKKSLELANQTQVDSIVLWGTMRLSVTHLNVGNPDLFKSLNYQCLKMAKRLDNPKAIAYSMQNLSGYYLHQTRVMDSTYYFAIESLKYDDYLTANEKFTSYDILSSIYEDLRLYLKSEQNIIIGLRYLDPLPESEKTLENRWTSYNKLGMIADDQEAYDKALNYYSKAVQICERMIAKNYEEGHWNLIITYNNIAEVYRNKNDYEQALAYYDKMRDKSAYFKYDPSLYAFLIDNVAMTKFSQGYENIDPIISDLKIAYHICDTLEENIYKIETKQFIAFDLAKVYKEQQPDSAYKYAKEAYCLSKSLKDNTYTLESLLYLSDLAGGDSSKAYLKEYITLSDSITKEERNVRNKFARVEYESDQLETLNKQLTKEKKWLYAIAISLFVLSILVYIIFVQRSRNRKLVFSRAQQKANEDIYDLILTQQHKLEEGRLQERHRVSEELHDGVLSKLFGTRLGLSFLELEGESQDLKKFDNYLEQINTIEKEVRQLSHNLKSREFRVNSDFNSLLKNLLEEQSKLYDLHYSLTNSHVVDWKTVKDKIKVNIYRIVQEALYNTIKHAKAKTIDLDFKSTENNLLITISDDGHGFNSKKASKGIGLKNIKSRIKKLNGTIFVTSFVNKGTTIAISIPL